ncbi:DUF3311 domain-containing protein [Arthrobacter sp. A5]|uniref:DUF3311 domain-containing protein n=1 Tax=Arthrobacter sp. A5 TaxID=576926 RepID=UPI003DA8D7AF
MYNTELPQDIPTRGPAKPVPYLISGVLLIIAIVFPLIVPMYARATPRVGGLPFFYWYQMLWVPIDAVLIGICYALTSREDRRRREVLKRPAAGSAGGGTTDGGAVR